jgi:hypothetical protein
MALASGGTGSALSPAAGYVVFPGTVLFGLLWFARSDDSDRGAGHLADPRV